MFSYILFFGKKKAKIPVYVGHCEGEIKDGNIDASYGTTIGWTEGTIVGITDGILVGTTIGNIVGAQICMPHITAWFLCYPPN